MNKKRMYSLNLAAYVITATDLEPQVEVDETTHTAYFIYPECAAVAIAVNKYKAGYPYIDLHKFLAAIKRLRTKMTEVLQKKEEC